MAFRLPATDALSRRNVRFWAFVAFLSLVALFGGASRADSLAQPVVRVVALGYAAMLVLAGWIEWRRVRQMWVVSAILAGCAALVTLQLLPLPPGVWSSLAGREFYLQAAAIAGLEQPWRPLTLSPDRTWNALYALSVPAAAAIGLASLDRQARANLVWPVMLIMFLSAVLGLAQVSGGPSSPLRWYAVTNTGSAVGLFANRNHAALFLACFFPLLALVAMRPTLRRGTSQVRTWIGVGAALFVLLMVVLTGSRAGLVLTTLAAVWAMAFLAPAVRARLKKVRRKRRRLYLLAFAVGIVATVAIVISLQQAVAVQRLRDLGVLDETRMLVWPISWRMSGEFFPFGIGFGAFDPVYRRFEPFDALSTNYINAVHNDFLQVLLEGGLFGVVLIGIALVWWAVASLRILRTDRDASHAKVARVGSIIILFVFLASAVDYPARTPLIMVLVVIAACWMQLAEAGRSTLRNQPGSLRT